MVGTFEEEILNGTLKVGEPLPPEREIVERYGVSRTVVREAVLALANRGLVKARRGFRPVVAQPGYDTALDAVGAVARQLLGESGGVRNLFDLRVILEASLVRSAALNASTEEIQALKDALAANGAAIADNRRFFLTDTAFHAVFFRVPGNPLLPAIHRAFTDWLAPHWEKMPRSDTRNAINHAAHTEIFQAILMRDPDAAEAALRGHLKSAWEQVAATFAA